MAKIDPSKQIPEKPAKDAGRESSKETSGQEDKAIKRIYLVPFPKIIFLYPTVLAALVSAIVLTFAGAYAEDSSGPSTVAVYTTVGFLTVFVLNFIVLSFDFPRATSLTAFFVVAALVLGAILLFTFNPTFLPWISNHLHDFKPAANSTFFWTVSGFFLLMYLVVAATLNFDYWEVRQNELLHHHGILSDLERFSAPNIRIDKEINDIFEYLLLGSGRLIVHPSGERKAIVLDNILFISKKEKSITKMLGALQVDVRSDR